MRGSLGLLITNCLVELHIWGSMLSQLRIVCRVIAKWIPLAALLFVILAFAVLIFLENIFLLLFSSMAIVNGHRGKQELWQSHLVTSSMGDLFHYDPVFYLKLRHLCWGYWGCLEATLASEANLIGNTHMNIRVIKVDDFNWGQFCNLTKFQ